MEEEKEKKHNYQCGECHFGVTIGPKDAVRCLNCGYRILYKVKSSAWTQYEAR
ncbi:DNA-directed RNA polymerases I, II, and III subunit RPABC4 [Nematocida sp. AWRm77]|nr:DNA-directed RNA polymerases I, II, and III subunit RPABC4 [Nematocida sp. AWRm77]